MTSPASAADPPRGSTPRILYLLTTTISARFTHGQLAHLQRRGFECHVGVGGPHGDDELFDDGVTVHDAGFVREIRLRQDVESLVRTLRLIRRLRPDHVNVSTPKAALIGMVAAWVLRVPHRVYVVRGLRYETMTGWRRRCFVAIERLISACAHDVVFVSRSLMAVAHDDRACARRKGRILGRAGSGNGVDTARFEALPTVAEARDRLLGHADGARMVGFVGRLTRDKGVADLVAAFERVAAAVPDTELVLVGDIEEGDPLPARVRDEIQSDERIHVTGWIADPLAIYRAFDVLAFPSYREGLPNVPLESQLSGVPVVGYAATGTVDAVADGTTGVLVEPGDVDGLAGAMIDLLGDPERAAAMGAAGRDWVAEMFVQTDVWDALAEIYAAAGRR